MKARTLLILSMLTISTGCELVASVYVQKEWVTDHHLTKPDAVTKFELKATKLVGRDAKLANLKEPK